MVMGRKGREGKKSQGSSTACHFCHKDGHWKKDCKIRQEWLKKKGQAAEADVAMSSIETEVLTTSIFEDNTPQGKG